MNDTEKHGISIKGAVSHIQTEPGPQFLVGKITKTLFKGQYRAFIPNTAVRTKVSATKESHKNVDNVA